LCDEPGNFHTLPGNAQFAGAFFSGDKFILLFLKERFSMFLEGFLSRKPDFPAEKGIG
jgi:hypothetical protein